MSDLHPFRSFLLVCLLALATGCGGAASGPETPDAPRADATDSDVVGADSTRDATPDASAADAGAPDAGAADASWPDGGRGDARRLDAARDQETPGDSAAGGDGRDTTDGHAVPPDARGDGAAHGDAGGCEAGCCGDGDCDDDNACTVDRCEGGECVHAFDPCDDGNECTRDSCNVQTGCVHDAIEGCCPLTWQWEQGFETGDAAGFEVVDLATNTRPASDPLDTPIVWNVTSRRARSGSWSLYSGDPRTFGYDNGRWVASRAVSPPFPLAADRPSELVFWAWLGVEAGAGIDTLNVSVATDAGTIPLWAKHDRIPLRDWHRVAVDLAAFRGQTVRFVFQFDSLDGRYNDYEGVYLDDIAVGVACAPRGCASDEDCDDAVACSVDSCGDQSACNYGAWPGCCLNPADCRDGDPCTVDLCEAGACRWIADPEGGCCDTDATCDDGDPCTDDSCYDHRCRHTPSGVAGCCATDADCATLDPCYVGACDDDGACLVERVCCERDDECADSADLCVVGTCLPSGACEVAPSGQPGCCEREVFTADFEAGGLTDFVTDNDDEAVGWTTHGGVGTQSRTVALYYGRPATGDYDTGGRNGGLASTLPIPLPAAVESQLAFRMLLDVEPGATHDRLTVAVRVRDTSLVIWEKTPQTPMQSWIDVAVDLSGFAGETVQIQWTFDTMDGEGNSREGVYVDDIALTSSCAQRSCLSDAVCADVFGATEGWCGERGTCQYRVADDFCAVDGDCNDEDVCTTDACADGACAYTPIDGCCHDGRDCDDGDVCTTDLCMPGPPPTCRHNRTPDCCVTDGDCDDHNRCTVDTCPGEGGACVREWIAGCCLSSLDCDDGDSCTEDRCVEGACDHLPVCCAADGDCDDGDDLCTVDTCGADQRCVFTPTGAPGCCRDELLLARWDGLYAADFGFTNPQPQYGWFLVEDGPPSALPGVALPYLYFGDPRDFASYGHHDAGANEATARSPWIELPAAAEITVGFAVWMNTEARFDSFAVLAELGGPDFNGYTTVLYESDEPARAWEEIALDLSFAAGAAVRLVFRAQADETFFAGDAALDWQGIFVDDVAVRTTCLPAPCADAADCAALDCVEASCLDGACVFDLPAPCCDGAADCDDDNPCTEDRCVAHRCVSDPTDEPGCCVDDDACADDDPCTVAVCVDNQCAVTFSEGCTPVAPWCQEFAGSATLGALGFDVSLSPPEQASAWEVGAIGGTGLDGPHLSFAGEGLAAPYEQCVRSPVLDAATLGATRTLRFRQNVVAANPPGDVVLAARVSGDGGQTWAEVWSLAVDDTGPAHPDAVTVTLPPVVSAASTLRLALCATGATPNGLSRWNVDDLCLLDGGAPAFAPVDDVVLEIGELADVPLEATDPDGDPIVLDLLAGPGFVFLADHGDGHGTLSVAPGVDDRGSYDVVIEASDGHFRVETAFRLEVVVPGEVQAYVEDFAAAAGPDGFAAVGWEEWIDVGAGAGPGDGNWRVHDDSGNVTGVVARFEDTPAATDFDHWLVSPVFDASSLGQATVAWTHAFDWSCCDPLYLVAQASGDAGATWTELWRWPAHLDSDLPLGETAADATAVIGGSTEARIAFRVLGADSYDLNYWEIDRVEVRGLDVGDPPVWEPLPPLLAAVGTRATFPLAANDPDSADLTFVPGGDTPPFVSIENDGLATATLVVTLGLGDEGVHAFQLRVTDGFHPVSQPAELRVFVPGAPPVPAPVGEPTVVAGEVLKVDLAATDPDGQPVAWTAAAPLPTFASLRDHGGGAATLTLAPSLADVGRHAVRLAVDDTTQSVPVDVPVSVVVPGGAPLLVADFEGAASLAALGWTTWTDEGSAANDWTLAAAPTPPVGSARARFADFPRVFDFEDLLVSPPVDTAGVATLTVRFWTAFASYLPEDGDPPVMIRLLASGDDGATWTPLWSHGEGDGDLPFGPVDVGPLGVGAGQPLPGGAPLRFAFAVSGGDSATILAWDVDDVSVGGAPAEAP